jgi:hypothetical protein
VFVLRAEGVRHRVYRRLCAAFCAGKQLAVCLMFSLGNPDSGLLSMVEDVYFEN